jgi:hypothetical protein
LLQRESNARQLGSLVLKLAHPSRRCGLQAQSEAPDGQLSGWRSQRQCPYPCVIAQFQAQIRLQWPALPSFLHPATEQNPLIGQNHHAFDEKQFPIQVNLQPG